MNCRTKKAGLRFAVLFLLCCVLSVPAFAADLDEYTDVPTDSPWCDGIRFVTEHGISKGVGNHRFAPDQTITVRQWAVMLCRAFCPEMETEGHTQFGTKELKHAMEEHWISRSQYQTPDASMDRGNLTAAAGKTADMECFHRELYPDGCQHVLGKNSVCMRKEPEQIEKEAASCAAVTRGEAAYILCRMLSDEPKPMEPPAEEKICIVNRDNTDMEPYLAEIKRIPAAIQAEFESRGWKYILDSQYLKDYSQSFGQNCIGLCDYSNHCLYLAVSSPTLHEFGHFYHRILGFPNEIDELYRAEAENAAIVLRKYSTVNSHEFFADYFAYWIRNAENEENLQRMQEVSPSTYRYFSQLAANEWKIP